ncbi:hypothetical protein HDU93_000897 [Gonapodya sp. JEL0774]|nr:hypothetical protein HDU93_000897 [Gonapodya sp. JEL0774]
MNADGAQQALGRSRARFKEGELDDALRLAKKAVQMHTSLEATDWLEFLERKKANPEPPGEEAGSNPGSTNGHADPTSSNGPRRRAAPTPSTTSASSSASSLPDSSEPSRSYTSAQEKECQRIIKVKHDFYAVLGLEKTCSADEIKKAYRKLALQFHPDKNSAPGASEAFKAIGRAFSCLSDEGKRVRYDQIGGDPDSRGSAGGGGGGGMPRGFRSEFETELTPEDIFNMFFGGDFGPQFARGPGGGVYRVYRNAGPRRRQTNTGQGEGVGNPLTQLLPLVILVMAWIMMALVAPGSDSTRNFSFTQHPSYPIRRETPRNHVTYFVTPKFPHLEPPTTHALRRDLASIEDNVESQYLDQLRRWCQVEMERKNMAIARSRGLWKADEKMLKEAQAMETPRCEELRSFKY